MAAASLLQGNTISAHDNCAGSSGSDEDNNWPDPAGDGSRQRGLSRICGSRAFRAARPVCFSETMPARDVIAKSSRTPSTCRDSVGPSVRRLLLEAEESEKESETSAFETLRRAVTNDTQGSTRMFRSPNSIHRTFICAGMAAAVVLTVSGCRQTRQHATFSHRHATSGIAETFPSISDLTSPSSDAPPERPSDDYDADLTPLTGPEATTTMIPGEPGLSPEESAAMFRQAGGTLRPDADGTIVEIDLSFSRITDDQIAAISLFPEVRELDLTGTELHDDAMQSLIGLNRLQSLKLKGTKITSDGLSVLSQITTLILLDASSTNVSDDGLVSAGAWTKLRYLSLNSTGVSDTGIMQLQALQTLKGLSLINTAVTEEGVRNLKTLLPDCLIVAQTDPEVSRAEGLDSLPRLPLTGPMSSLPAGMGSAVQLEQVIEFAGLQPHLAVHLSSIYSSRGQWEEAGRILETAAVSDHDDAAIQFCLGEALARTDRTEAAFEHFERSVGEAAASYNVGLIVYENMLEECEDYFMAALDSDPSLQVAQAKLTDIQRELWELRQRRNSASIAEADDTTLEVVPALPIRQATQTKTRSAR